MQSFDFGVNLALINLNRFEQLSAIAMSPHRAARVTCPAMLSRHWDNLYLATEVLSFLSILR